MESNEVDRLDSATRKLLEYEQVLGPKWKRTVESARNDVNEKESLFKAAQKRVEELQKKKQEVQFACKVFEERAQLLTDDKNQTDLESTENLKDQWNRAHGDLAKLKANKSECEHYIQQMKTEVGNLEQFNVDLRQQLASSNHRKRIQAEAIISSRKRMKELEDTQSSLQARKKDLTHKLAALDHEGMQYRALLQRHQTLTHEIEEMRASNVELALQTDLETTILAEVKATIKDSTNSLQELRRVAMQDENEIQHLEQLIRQAEDASSSKERKGKSKEGNKNNNKENNENQSSEWSSEARELWQECAGLKNKNKHIFKNIEQLKMEKENKT